MASSRPFDISQGNKVQRQNFKAVLHSPHSRGFWRTIISGTLSLTINLLALALHVVLLPKPHRTVYPPAVLGVLASTLSLSTVFIERRLWKEESINGIQRWQRLRLAAAQSVFILALVSIITSVTIMTVEGIDSDGKHDNVPDPITAAKAMTAIFSCFAIASNAALLEIVADLTCWPIHDAARSTMTVASLSQFVVGTLLVAVNEQPEVSCAVRSRSFVNAIFALYQHVGAIVTGISILGLAICIAIRANNRINSLLTSFIRFYILLSVFTALLCISIFAFSLWIFLRPGYKTFIQDDTLTSNPVLAGLALILISICMVAANYLQEPPASYLAVETIDLNALTPAQRDAYANLIEKYGNLVPGAPSGEAAMSLMHAYTNSSLPHMNCTVLRVFNPAVAKERMLLRKSHEDDRAWSQLDEEQMVLRDVLVSARRDTLLDPEKPDTKPKLSKYQQKKLARKQASVAAKGKGIATAEDAVVDRVIEKVDKEFLAKLESTEALILLTTISDYDLTASVGGWLRKLLQRTLGSKSFFKPMCVRLGLLAFHWPFRESTFYCSYARKPVARSAAVLRAISRWNKARPRSQRCSVLLDPTYQHEAVDHAIVPSGWQRTPLPASHIIDLRPYKGKTAAEYLKAIKYRDQENAFKKANGDAMESWAFTVEECVEVMRLWRQTAEKRTSTGQTAELANPDEKFLTQLGAGNSKDRSLMFLKADGHIIASCVLFRLGDTITSDIQGLDYERARPLKAYFVMIQHVIAITLCEGHSFVDFGPTTPKPKLDIDCKSVPLIGAMFAMSPIISAAIEIAAQHTQTKLKQG